MPSSFWGSARLEPPNRRIRIRAENRVAATAAVAVLSTLLVYRHTIDYGFHWTFYLVAFGLHPPERGPDGTAHLGLKVGVVLVRRGLRIAD